MRMSYNPRSGHVKRDGAVVGVMERTAAGYQYRCYCVRRVVIKGESVVELMSAVRKHYEGKK